MKAKDIILLILRLLIGALFITTAIMKLLTLDEFEAYIYSFNLFSFLLSTVVARLVIMAELLLGICLMSKMLYKYAWWMRGIEYGLQGAKDHRRMRIMGGCGKPQSHAGSFDSVGGGEGLPADVLHIRSSQHRITRRREHPRVPLRL